MEEIIGIIIIRSLISTLGQTTRYLFFRLLGKKKPFKSYAYQAKNEYKDLEKMMSQDFLNKLVGFIVLFFLVITCVGIFL
jgi:hypothetical protein